MFNPVTKSLFLAITAQQRYDGMRSITRQQKSCGPEPG
jgi:hypothetical protein